MKHFGNMLFLACLFATASYGMNIELKVQADSNSQILPPAIVQDFKDKRIIQVCKTKNEETVAVASQDCIKIYDKAQLLAQVRATDLQSDLTLLDIALSSDGTRLFMLGLATGSNAKLLFAGDIGAQQIRSIVQHDLHEHSSDIVGRQERIRLLAVDNKNVIIYGENCIELWYVDNDGQRDYHRRSIFSYLDFPADMLPGQVKNRFEHHEAIAIQTVLFADSAMHIFYYNRGTACYALTTLNLTYSKTIGTEAALKVTRQKEIPLRWAVKFGNQFATAQLVTDGNKLFIYCDDIFYAVEDGRAMSKEFAETHRNIVARPSYAPESRLEESTERKQEESQSQELLTPKSSAHSSKDKESSKKLPNSRSEFLRAHKKKIIAGVVTACALIVACVLGFKYVKKKALCRHQSPKMNPLFAAFNRNNL